MKKSISKRDYRSIQKRLVATTTSDELSEAPLVKRWEAIPMDQVHVFCEAFGRYFRVFNIVGALYITTQRAGTKLVTPAA